MSVSKLTCPECRTVLRPTKPLPVGKKVKCPKCGANFTAVEPPPEPVAKKPKKAAPKPAPAKKKPDPKPALKPYDDDDDDEVGGTYAVVGADKTEDEAEEDDKPHIEYAPDMSIKDLRGPAVGALAKPTSYLMLASSLGFIGWLGFMVIVLIPIVFPIDNKSDKDKDKPAATSPANKDKASSAKKSTFFKVFEIDFADLAEAEWYWLVLALIGFAAGLAYTGVATLGGVSAANLESRTFGIVGSIMVMIPINATGMVFFICMILQIPVDMLFDEWTIYVMIVIATIVCLLSLGVGAWALTTLMSQEVIDGFEYKAE
jgi:hypothetical protein